MYKNSKVFILLFFVYFWKMFIIKIGDYSFYSGRCCNRYTNVEGRNNNTDTKCAKEETENEQKEEDTIINVEVI